MRALNCANGGGAGAPLTPCTSGHVINHNNHSDSNNDDRKGLFADMGMCTDTRMDTHMDMEMGACACGSPHTVVSSKGQGGMRQRQTASMPRTMPLPVTPSPKKSATAAAAKNHNRKNKNNHKRVTFSPSPSPSHSSSSSILTTKNPLMQRIVSRTTKFMEVVNCAYAMRQLEDEWLQDAEDDVVAQVTHPHQNTQTTATQGQGNHQGNHMICEAEQLWLEQQRQRLSVVQHQQHEQQEAAAVAVTPTSKPARLNSAAHREVSTGTAQATRGDHAHVPAHALTDGHQHFYKTFFAADNDDDYAESQFMRRSFAVSASATSPSASTSGAPSASPTTTTTSFYNRNLG
jgi:hypothetical protein